MKHTVNSGHDEADLGRIGGAGEMRVNLLGLMLVQAHEAVENVVAGSSVVVTTLVVGEVVLHGADGQLLLESINLVEEQNDRSLDEPSRVADGVEERQGFLHTVDGLIFKQKLVVLGNGDKEENGGDVLEAVNPLLSLRTLTTDVEHAVGQVTNDECRLGNTSCLDTRAENILIIGHIIGSSNTSNVVKVAAHGSAIGA